MTGPVLRLTVLDGIDASGRLWVQLDEAPISGRSLVPWPLPLDLAETLRRAEDESPGDRIELGSELLAALRLASPTLASALGEALGRTPCPITLAATSSTAAQLPWEVLFERDLGRFVEFAERSTISRCAVDSTSARTASTVLTRPLRVVAVLSAPSPDPGVTDDWSRDELAVLASRLDHDELLVVTGDPDTAAYAESLGIRTEPLRTAASVRDAVASFTPHVVHFFCHGFGGRGVASPHLRLSTSSDREIGTPSIEIDADLVADAATEASVVVLNSCSGAAQAEDGASLALALTMRGVPVVIAMTAEIDHRQATSFTAGLYDSIDARLADATPGTTVDLRRLCGLGAARRALLESTGEPFSDAAATHRLWARPVVYTRLQDVTATVLDIRSSPEVEAEIRVLHAGRAQAHRRAPERALEVLDDRLAELGDRSIRRAAERARTITRGGGGRSL